MKVIGNEGRQETGRHLNNRAENSHLPIRRRERAMSRFRRMRSLQKFVSIHSSVYNHFNFERHISTRIRFKQKRDAALREWRDLLAGLDLIVREKRRLVRVSLTPPFSGHAVRFGEKAFELICFRSLVLGFRCGAGGFAVCHRVSLQV
jgi:hypothetical protein